MRAKNKFSHYHCYSRPLGTLVVNVLNKWRQFEPCTYKVLEEADYF